MSALVSMLISSKRGLTARNWPRSSREVEAMMIAKTAAKSLLFWAGRSRPSFRKLKNDGVERCPVAMAAATEICEVESNGVVRSGRRVPQIIMPRLGKHACPGSNLIEKLH